jgi:asparagine synthase (glutamine-hydrolysing)
MVLSGDGGDEAFGGYKSYDYWLQIDPIRQARQQVWSNPRASFYWARQALRNNFSNVTTSSREWELVMTLVHEPKRRALWRSEYQDEVDRECELFSEADSKARTGNRLSYAQYMDYQTYLPCDILTKVDVASMYHGLEVRTPFIDVRVVEWAAKLPLSQRIRKNGSAEFVGKSILKRVLEKFLPREVVYRKKQGFSIPRDRWFLPEQPARKMLEKTLATPESKLFSFFDSGYMQEQLRAHTVNNDNSDMLWSLLVLGIWFEQNPQLQFS